MRVSSAVLAGILAMLPAAAVAQRTQQADVLVVGGRVVDGTGAAERVADVAISGDRISFIGNAAAAGITSQRVIDARGLLVTPGFIDPHTHTFEDLSSTDAGRRRNAAYLAQGVTTVITGNDGGGPTNVGETFARWTQAGIGTNAALLVGFGTARTKVLGMSSSAPTPAQLAAMQALVRQGMTDGALGMSAGLYYAPQSYATTDEVIAVAKEIAPFNGVYDTHLRDESSYTIGLFAAISEAIRIGREAGVAVNISHLKALGVDVWHKSDSAIALIRAARQAGQMVTADQYPYTASGSSVGASLLPRWAEAGGRDSLRARLADSATRRKITAEMTENLRRRGGAESILITEPAPEARAVTGKRLNEIAESRHVSPIDAAVEIILAGDASIASFNMHEDDIANFMYEDFVTTGSDGSDGHPRKFGTYPRKFREYVMTNHVLTVPEFVRRSSAQVAENFGLRDRGVLRVGAFADVAVIDPSTFTDRATYEAPTQLATGVRFLAVNGRVAIQNGVILPEMGGLALRRER